MIEIDAGTRLVALIGSPVSHSLSPTIHNAAFAAAGLNIRYVAFDVTPIDLEAAVGGLRALGALGANVTIPLKRDVARFVDSLSPVARASGAVNTLVFKADENSRIRVEGDNTDVSGFVRSLDEHRENLIGKPVLVLGAGGAARAVTYALARQHAPESITIAARSRQSILSLMRQFEKRGIVIDAVPFDQAAIVAANAALVVNTTPIGMHPNVDASPLPDGVVGKGQIVYDLVYNPTETRLLRDSAANGAITIGGTDMLFAQAAESFRLWTGVEMPEQAARAAIEAELRRSRER